MAIEAQDVHAFKTHYCDENETIGRILRDVFVPRMPPVILDVGAGMGDIARAAFPDKQTILLDTTSYDLPVAPNHTRVTGDFFNWNGQPKGAIGTVLFCHSLQYLDDDVQLLKLATLNLNPTAVVTVTNNNDDLLGELIQHVRNAGLAINPEEEVPSFPPAPYVEEVTSPFEATVSANDFTNLAWAITYLFDVPGDRAVHSEVEAVLRHALPNAQMKIRQTIRLYCKSQ